MELRVYRYTNIPQTICIYYILTIVMSAEQNCPIVVYVKC